MSTALSDINKAWQSVAELKKELERTERKLQKAAKISFRSTSSTSVFSEINPVLQSYVKSDLVIKNGERNQEYGSLPTRSQLTSRSHERTGIKRMRKISRKDTSHVVENRSESSTKLPLKDLSWKQNQISQTESDCKYTKNLTEENQEELLVKNVLQERANDAYNTALLRQAAAETTIRYVNDYIPSVYLSSRKENNLHSDGVKGNYKRPSSKGLQHIRDVVERQKQQLQFAFFKNDNRGNADVLNSKDNLRIPLEDKNEETNRSLNDGNIPTATSSVLPEESVDNMPPIRKTVTAALPPPYRGFAHSGDKHVRWKGQSEMKPKFQQKQKMKRLKRFVDTSDKKEFITPSCWRDAQEMIKKALGPAPVLPSTHNSEYSTKNDTEKQVSELLNDKTGTSMSSSINDEVEIPMKDVSVDHKRTDDDKHTVPRENQQSIIEDKKDDKTDITNKTSSTNIVWKEGKTTKASPAKRTYSKKRKAVKPETEKIMPAPKIRHYDPHVVRTYIDKKKIQRQQTQKEEQKKKKLAEEFKKQRLQQLYAFQKQAATTSHISTKKRPETSVKSGKTLINESIRKSSLASSITDPGQNKSLAAKISIAIQHDDDDEKSNTEISDNIHNEDVKKPISEETTSVSIINDLIDNVPRKNNEQESLEIPNSTKEICSEEKMVPVLDERVTMLKQFATSLQDQIALETQRIHMLLQKPIHKKISTHSGQLDNSRNLIHYSVPIQNFRPGMASTNELLHINEDESDSQSNECLPGVSNIHLHISEVNKMQVRTQAAIKIQTVYRGFRARKIYKEMLSVKEKSFAIEKLEGSLSEGPLESDDDLNAAGEGSQILTKLKDHAKSEDAFNLPGQAGDSQRSHYSSRVKSASVDKQKEIKRSASSSKDMKTITSSSSAIDKLISDAQHIPQIVDLPDYSSDFAASADEAASIISGQDLPSESLISDASVRSASNLDSGNSTSVQSSQSFNSSKQRHELSVSSVSTKSHTLQSDISNENELAKQVSAEEIHSEILPEVSGDVGTLSEGTLSTLSEGQLSHVHFPETTQSEINNDGKALAKPSAINSIKNEEDVSKRPVETLLSVSSLSTSKLKNVSEVIEVSVYNTSSEESSKVDSLHTSHSSKNKAIGTSRTPSGISTASSISNHSLVDSGSDSSTIKEHAEQKSSSYDSQKTSESQKGSSHISKRTTSTQDGTSDDQITVLTSSHHEATEANDGRLPSVLGMCMSAELSHLDAVNNSLLYLSEFGHINTLINHERDTLTLAHILQVQEGRRQEQQENMMHQILKQQESQARLMEETRNEQRRLLQDIIAEAHAAIAEKTLKVVEVQAEAVKSSADALLGLAESRKFQRDPTSNYSSDFEQISGKDSHLSVSKDNLLTEHALNTVSPNSSIPEEVENASNQSSRSIPESKESNGLHLAVSPESIKGSEEAISVVHTKGSRESIDESLPESIHSDYISEGHQNSSQKSRSESSSTIESPPAGDNFIDKSVQVSSIPGHRHNAHNMLRHRAHVVISDQDSLSSLDQLSLSTEERNSEGLQSLISDDSFTKFTIDMFHRLAQGEQIRTRHQLARLQLQEKELMSKAKAELACLELLKKKLKQNGSHEKVSSVRKKQRALLLQLHQERAQLRYLQETYRNTLRKSKFTEKKKPQEVKDFQLPTSSSQLRYLKSQKSEDTKSSKSTSAQPSSSTDIVSSENDIGVAVDSDDHLNTQIPSEVPSVVSEIPMKSIEVLSKTASKHSQEKIDGTTIPRHDSNYTFESLLQGIKRLEVSKRYLTKREQKLVQRRKDVENLLEWQQKLNVEEAQLRGIEHKLLVMERDRKERSNSITSLKGNVIKSDVAIERTGNMEFGYSSTSVPQTDIEGSPGSSIESQGISQKDRSGSGSSIQEEMLSLKPDRQDVSESIPEEVLTQPRKSSSQEEILSLKNEEQDASGSIPEVSTEPRKRSSETDLYSESFEPSDHVNSNAQQSNESTEQKSGGTTKKSQNITIRFPLVPRTHRRHDSSGSEDSFTISQSETASDQSDIEGRIHALNDELKKRQAEAEKLKKENKRRYREQLKERESSLKKQIEVYDQYIQKAKRELEQHLESGSSLYLSPDSTPVKPQIKQPCVAESRRLRRNFSSGDLSPPSEALKVNLSHKTSETGTVTSPETDNDKEQSLSQTSTITSSIEGKTSSHNTDDSTTSKLHIGGGDVVVSTSASIVNTEVTRSGDKLCASAKERINNLQTDLKSEISDKSGATLSEAKQTVIEDMIPSILENDDTEIEVEISEDSAGSEGVLKSEGVPIEHDEKLDIVTNQQENDMEIYIDELHSTTASFSHKKNESTAKTSEQRKETVDKLTGDIFDLLCKDAFVTVKSAPVKLQQALIESSPTETEVIIPENEIMDDDDKEKQDSSEIFSEKLVGVLIKDSIDCVFKIVEQNTAQHITSFAIEKKDEQQVSDTSKKVNSILATLNDKKLAKEKLRPQDLMLLSPLLDTIDDNNWEITTDLDVDTVDINEISLDPSTSVTQKQDFVYESEWFDDDDFGLGQKDNEQTTQNDFLHQYYREIPNKPPPPYTPPSPKFEEKKNEIFSVVAHTPKEVQSVVTEAVTKLFEGIQQNIPLSDIQPPSKYIDEQEQDVTIKSQKCYKQFLFDLTKEIANEMYSETKEASPPWIKAWKLNRKSLLPSDSDKFIATVSKKTMELLDMQGIVTSTGQNKQGSLMKLGRKKRDFVDNILIQELREEEHSWVNYEQDEIFIKTEIADNIFDTLIEDTIKTIQEFQHKCMILDS